MASFIQSFSSMVDWMAQVISKRYFGVLGSLGLFWILVAAAIAAIIFWVAKFLLRRRAINSRLDSAKTAPHSPPQASYKKPEPATNAGVNHLHSGWDHSLYQRTLQSRSVRVFVSSTFLDMKRERDIIVKMVFPKLRATFRARGVEIVEVDLRWGVQSERGETLGVLLREIDRCRPFFIGFLGDRYGWVPPESAITDQLVSAYPILADANGASVTEIEIVYGVLSRPQSHSRAFFFKRDSQWNWIEGLSEHDRSLATSELTSAQSKLAALDAAVRARHDVKEYKDPNQIQDELYSALYAEFDAIFPEDSLPDAYDLSAMLHSAYARERTRLYVGGTNYFAQLDDWLDAADAQPMMLGGASGSGKSALVANWLRSHKSDSSNLVFEHYIAASSDSATPELILRRLWDFLDRVMGESEPQPPADTSLLVLSAAVAVRLSEAYSVREDAGFGRVIIALDGLDKLASDGGVSWLPVVPGVKFLGSSLDGEIRAAALADGWRSLEVKPLNRSEQRDFIHALLETWGRKISAELFDKIIECRVSTSPLFLMTVLDELRVSATNADLALRVADYTQ